MTNAVKLPFTVVIWRRQLDEMFSFYLGRGGGEWAVEEEKENKETVIRISRNKVLGTISFVTSLLKMEKIIPTTQTSLGYKSLVKSLCIEPLVSRDHF